MTNKPMLSVEREVIEKALRDALTIRFDTDSHVTKLRSLLDKPAEIDLTPKRLAHAESVIEQQNNVIKSLRAELVESYRVDSKHQGEPVVKAKPVAKLHAERLSGRDGEYGVTVEDSEWLNTCRLTGGIFNLYCEQSAPVAVDTERLDFILCKSRTVTTEILPDGYALYVEEGLMGEKVYPQVKASIVGKENRKSLQRQAIDLAIAEVARLNGGKP